MLLYGAGLAVPGGILLFLGGSPFYLIAGLTAIGCAFLLWRGAAPAPLLYALLLSGTLIWALWESGLDGWALMPRLGLPILLGLWLLTPSVHRGLRGTTRLARAVIAAASVTGIVLIVIGVTARIPSPRNERIAAHAAR
jgi:quinoprotein glucose dehydrogenase